MRGQLAQQGRCVTASSRHGHPKPASRCLPSRPRRERGGAGRGECVDGERQTGGYVGEIGDAVGRSRPSEVRENLRCRCGSGLRAPISDLLAVPRLALRLDWASRPLGAAVRFGFRSGSASFCFVPRVGCGSWLLRPDCSATTTIGSDGLGFVFRRSHFLSPREDCLHVLA